MYRILICFAVVIVSFGCTKKYKMHRETELNRSDWQFSRKNAQSMAYSSNQFSGRLDVIWEEKVSGAPAGPMTIGGNCLIIPDSKGKINFFDIKSGKYMGRLKVRYPVQGGLIVADSLAYLALGPQKNELFCINLYNRNILWNRHLKDIVSPPIIVDNRIFIASPEKMAMCLDRLTGQILWVDSTEAGCIAGPSYYKGRVYFPMEDGQLNIYESEGELIMKLALGGPLVSKTVIDDRIYMADNIGGVYALEIESGLVVWDRKFDWPIWTSPAVDEHLVYFGDNAGRLRALDKKTGETVWEFETNGVIVSSPIVAGEYVVFASLDRHLYCLDRTTGRLKSQREYDHAIRQSAVSSDDAIYIALQNGIIQCLGE